MIEKVNLNWWSICQRNGVVWRTVFSNYGPWGLGLPLNADTEKVAETPEDRFKFIGRESQQSTEWADLLARKFLVVDPVTEIQGLSIHECYSSRACSNKCEG